MAFHLTGEPAADQVLDEYPFAVLVGMMLDQQYGMEHAFRGGWKVLDRFGTLDPGAIAAADPEQFTALCSQPPAIHRYPKAMAVRLQELASLVESDYAGDASRLWTEASTGGELLRRIQALPGFGRQKAQIFVALLAKQLRRPARRVGEGRGRLRVGRLPVRGRRRGRRLAAEGARLQAAEEGRGQGGEWGLMGGPRR